MFAVFSSAFLTSSALVRPTTSPLTVVSMEPATAFEPILPDPVAIAGFASVVVLSAVATWVWANQVVPVSRTKLAISKRSGPVREYLDELGSNTTESRDLERWLFDDWLQNRPERKAPAVPILKNAKWNSGDNPVLAATGLILLGVIFTSITERLL